MSDSSRSKAPIPSEIQKLLGIVRGRLGFERFLAGLHDTLVISLVIILLLVVASKLSPVVEPTWWIVFSVLGGLSIIGALVASRLGAGFPIPRSPPSLMNASDFVTDSRPPFTARVGKTPSHVPPSRMP